MKDTLITAIVMVLLIVAILFLVGLLIQFLWNWLMVGIFALSPINQGQAIGLLILFNILFGGVDFGTDG